MSDNIILIADDDDNDVLLLRLALQSAGIENETRVVSDGEEAICYLKGEGLYANRLQNPFPILMFLNLQMPRRNGGEVLAWLGAQPSLPLLKLAVLTGTLDPKQKTQAVYLGARLFLNKPPRIDDLLKLLEDLDDLVIVPSGNGYKLQWSAALLMAGICMN